MLRKINQKWNMHRTHFFIFAILVLWFSHIFAGGNESGDSPQTVFKAAQEAGAKKDFSSLTKLVAPSQLTMMAFGSDFGVSMFVEFYEGPKATELKKKYQETQKKYQINYKDEGEKLQITQDTPPELIDEHMRKRAENKYGHVDVVKYIPELMAIVLDMPEMAEQPFFPQEKLTDLKIDGDNATGKAGEKSISFIREDDRWYLTADVMD